MADSRLLDPADRMIENLDGLHSGPQIAQRILVLTRHPDYDLDRVVECLEHDPALSAKILRVVNSSRFGLGYEVCSIRHAAALLGRRSLRLATLSFALIDSLMRGARRQLVADFWRRSLTMAAVAERLARRSCEADEGEAYTAGLLADVGILALAQLKGDECVPLYKHSPHGPSLADAEFGRWGIDHPRLGARLLEHWGLPESLVEAVAHHHETLREGPALELAVRAGDWTADALWTENSPHVRAALVVTRCEFGLDLDGFIDLVVDCQAEVEESLRDFGFDAEMSEGREALLEQARQIYFQASFEAALEMDSIEMAVDSLSGSCGPR